ncbi:MAG: hypothetical protein ABSG39_03400, partial [Acidimicrobiales bacterium]
MIRRLALAVLVTALPLLAVLTTAVTTSAPPASAASTPVTAYWLVASDGGIFSFGGAPFYGSTGGTVLNKPIVGMAPTPDGGGYWLVASDGGIFSYGDAQFYGSTGSMTLNKPIVGMAPTPDGKGYWLVASDGGIFSYGDAQFYGSTGSINLNKPVVGMSATPSGQGYWLVASDGGIFSYGDAQFHGSTGSLALNKPVIGMITGPNGAGYFLVASDGGIFSFGSAPFYGSLGGLPLKNPIVTATAITDGSGYWFSDSAGLVSNFGSAKYYGSAPSPLNRPIVGMADAPGNGSFVGGTYPTGAYGFDISVYQCSSFPTGDHQIGIVQVDGSSSGNTNPCLAQEAAWAGGGLNLYTYLTYGTSATNEPGCNQDTSCNAGYQAGISAYTDAQNAGAGSTSTPWWLDVERAGANWSTSNLSENAQFVQGALNALHESEGIPDVGIYASPGVWNTIVGDYTPSVPYWMADYLASPSGPGSCADYQTWVARGMQLPGPPEV